MNGYGLLVGSTLPLIKDDNGWFATYRQYCGPTCTSGQIVQHILVMVRFGQHTQI